MLPSVPSMRSSVFLYRCAIARVYACKRSQSRVGRRRRRCESASRSRTRTECIYHLGFGDGLSPRLTRIPSVYPRPECSGEDRDPVEEIKSPDTEFVQGTAKDIGTDARIVTLADGQTVEYGYLLVAVVLQMARGRAYDARVSGRTDESRSRAPESRTEGVSLREPEGEQKVRTGTCSPVPRRREGVDGRRR